MASLFAMFLALGSNAQPAFAASIVVNSLADAVPAVVGDGQCTLREAVNNANGTDTSTDCTAGDAGPDTITFSVAGTINLVDELPYVESTMTVDGANSITLNGTPVSGHFEVGLSGLGNLTLLSMTLQNGHGPGEGGSIFVGGGTLTTSNVSFLNNSPSALMGYQVVETHAENGFLFNCGGAIFLGGSTYSGTGDTFIGNSADFGGAICSIESHWDITGSQFQGNIASFDGGAILSVNSSSTLAGSWFSGNRALDFGGAGGAILYEVGFFIDIDQRAADQGVATSAQAGGNNTVDTTTFAGNDAFDGGGVFVGCATVTINHSTFEGNSAFFGGGLSLDCSGFCDCPGQVVEGFAQGILSGSATIVNTTFSGNEGGIGASIFNDGQGLSLTNVTIWDSIANQSVGQTTGDAETRTSALVGGVGLEQGGGNLHIINTIVDTCAIFEPSGVTGGNNLTGSADCLTFLPPTSFLGDPNLGPLQNNGGPTDTRALLPGSDAINAADNGPCQTTSAPNDQRTGGFPRLVGDFCDVGAYEVQGDLAISKSATAVVRPGELISYTVTVTDVSGDGGTGVVVDDVIPAGTTFVSLVAPAGWTCAPGPNFPCSLAAFPAGGTAVFQVTVQAGGSLSDGTVLVNTATVDSLIDLNPANNVAVATTIVRRPDLVLDKAGPAITSIGGSIDYTITVTNAGAVAADDVVIDDILPAGVTVTSIVAPPGVVCTPANVASLTGTITCTVGTMAPGATVIIHVTVTVGAGSTYVNLAVTTTITPEITIANNEDSVITNIPNVPREILTPTETATESPTPTETETPTETPTETATEEPTETATEPPTEEPTATPTDDTGGSPGDDTGGGIGDGAGGGTGDDTAGAPMPPDAGSAGLGGSGNTSAALLLGLAGACIAAGGAAVMLRRRTR